PGPEAVRRLFAGFPWLAGVNPTGGVLDMASIVERLRGQGIAIAADAPAWSSAVVGSEAIAVLASLVPGTPLCGGDSGEPGYIGWICPHRTFFVLSAGADAPPALYTAQALEKALRDGALRPAEKA